MEWIGFLIVFTLIRAAYSMFSENQNKNEDMCNKKITSAKKIVDCRVYFCPNCRLNSEQIHVDVDLYKCKICNMIHYQNVKINHNDGKKDKTNEEINKTNEKINKNNEEFKFIANNVSKKIHRANCTHVEKITEFRHFLSAKEAVSLGYKQCEVCKPVTAESEQKSQNIEIKSSINMAVNNKKINSTSNQDELVLNFFLNKSAQEIGYDMKKVIQGCNRSTPFRTPNVIATVGFVSSIALEILKGKENGYIEAYDYLKTHICEFCAGYLSWSDFVSFTWDLQERYQLSKECSDKIITYIEGMAIKIMDYYDKEGIPFDFHKDEMKRIIFG